MKMPKGRLKAMAEIRALSFLISVMKTLMHWQQIPSSDQMQHNFAPRTGSSTWFLPVMKISTAPDPYGSSWTKGKAWSLQADRSRTTQKINDLQSNSTGASSINKMQAWWLHFFLESESRTVITRAWGEGETRNGSSTGRKFQLCKMSKC